MKRKPRMLVLPALSYPGFLHDFFSADRNINSKLGTHPSIPQWICDVGGMTDKQIKELCIHHFQSVGHKYDASLIHLDPKS